MFRNRREAGYLLAHKLKEEQVKFDLVLAIPRGGVITAEVIAQHFDCPLDIIMAKKIGSPSLPEYALGAISLDGEVLVHHHMANRLADMDHDIMRQLTNDTIKELRRRYALLRGNRSAIELKNRQVLLVDDGIATGFTIKAALDYLKRNGVASIVIATPVCSKNACQFLEQEVNQIVTLLVPEQFYAVSQFYKDYSAVEDREIIEMFSRNQTT